MVKSQTAVIEVIKSLPTEISEQLQKSINESNLVAKTAVKESEKSVDPEDDVDAKANANESPEEDETGKTAVKESEKSVDDDKKDEAKKSDDDEAIEESTKKSVEDEEADKAEKSVESAPKGKGAGITEVAKSIEEGSDEEVETTKKSIKSDEAKEESTEDVIKSMSKDDVIDNGKALESMFNDIQKSLTKGSEKSSLASQGYSYAQKSTYEGNSEHLEKAIDIYKRLTED